MIPVDDLALTVSKDLLAGSSDSRGRVATLITCRYGGMILMLLKSVNKIGIRLILAAGTRLQQGAGTEETPQDVIRNIVEKNAHESDERAALFSVKLQPISLIVSQRL